LLVQLVVEVVARFARKERPALSWEPQKQQSVVDQRNSFGGSRVGRISQPKEAKLGLWFVFGVSLGAAVGLVVDNLAFGSLFGLLVAIFMAAASLKTTKKSGDPRTGEPRTRVKP
jgi:F0F1-type ATP synthase assembly protein I